MELNNVPLNEKLNQNEISTNMTTSDSKNNNNIETVESIISQSNEPQKIKNKFEILLQLIKKSNSQSGIMKSNFNKWKNITFTKYKNIRKQSRKILIKKKFKIRRSKENQDLEEKDKKKIKVFEKFSLNLNEENEKRKKIIKFIEDRITSYISRKDILKKYYNIWLSKAYDKEKIITNKITKKKIFKFKVEKNNNIVKKEREEKIKNILNFKNSLRFYFKLWKNISMNKEIEVNKNSIINISAENDHPIKKVKILKEIQRPQKLENKRKMKLTKLIISNNNKEILRKYFKHWITLFSSNKNIDVAQEDKLDKNNKEIEENIKKILLKNQYLIMNKKLMI